MQTKGLHILKLARTAAHKDDTTSNPREIGWRGPLKNVSQWSSSSSSTRCVSSCSLSRSLRSKKDSSSEVLLENTFFIFPHYALYAARSPRKVHIVLRPQAVKPQDLDLSQLLQRKLCGTAAKIRELVQLTILVNAQTCTDSGPPCETRENTTTKQDSACMRMLTLISELRCP